MEGRGTRCGTTSRLCIAYLNHATMCPIGHQYFVDTHLILIAPCTNWLTYLLTSTSTPLCRIEPSADSAVQLSTVGGRAFPVAAARFWNRLPDNVTSANSLSAFQQQLKHSVLAVIPRHYPVTFLNCNTHSGPSSGIAT